MRALIPLRVGLLTAAVVALAPACVLELDLRSAAAVPVDPVDLVWPASPIVDVEGRIRVDVLLDGFSPSPVDEPVDEPVEEVVADDPLSDGGRAAWVFLHEGLVWVGPNATGDAAARFMPDGEPVDVVPFEIGGDTTAPRRTSNTSGSPYTSFGAPGCAPNTPACGPDNEDGPVLMGSFVLDGEEVLIAAGGKTGGDHTYVYVGRVVDGVAKFEYLDVAQATGPQTLGVSSIMSTSDGVLLGLPQRGLEGPRLLELLRAPPAADGEEGLEARLSTTCEADDGDICDLGAEHVPGLREPPGGPPVGRIGAIDAALEVARPAPGGEALVVTTWVGSTDGIARCDGPLAPATSVPDAWTAATPTSAAFTDVDPIRSDATSATPLRDRAIPGFASVGERVVFGRNTEDGPQLWRCTGPCDGDAWQTVAGVVDGAERVSIVQTFSGGILLGTDAAAGARLAVSVDGLTFSDVDVGEQLLGTRLLSAVAVESDHGPMLWVMTADDEGPPRLFRVQISL